MRVWPRGLDRPLFALTAAAAAMLLNSTMGAADIGFPTVVNAKHVMWGAGQG